MKRRLVQIAFIGAALFASADAFAQSSPPTVLPGLIDPNPVFPAANRMPAMLDLTNGATSDLLDKTLTLAREFWLLCVVLAVLWEAFGSAPTSQKDYGAVLYRAVMILFLLVWYRPIFGTVINLTQEVAARVTPSDAHAQFAEQISWATKVHDAQLAKAADGQPDPQLAAALQKWNRSTLGGLLFDGALGLMIMLGAAVHWVLRMFASILCALFYVIGPLALVFSLPRISGVGSKWFGHFVTVSSWPIFSGLLLAITLQLGVNGLYGQEAFGALAASLVTLLTAVATPILAGKLVGGSPSVVGHGASIAMRAISGGLNIAKHMSGGDSVARAASKGAGSSAGGASAPAASAGGAPPVNPPSPPPTGAVNGPATPRAGPLAPNPGQGS